LAGLVIGLPCAEALGRSLHERG